MKKINLALLFSLFYCPLFAQQIADTAFSFKIKKPAYPYGQGPVIALDQAHLNFHTLDGRYASFGKILKNDGYQLKANKKEFSVQSLALIQILVIANALGEDGPWVLPTKPAFSKKEIEAVTEWVKNGGSLFLFSDHMPFAGAAAGLAEAFGFKCYNGFAIKKNQQPEIFSKGNHLLETSIFTEGREPTDSLFFFTGQAFEAPVGAKIISRLDSSYFCYLPEKAWEFNDSTPSRSGDGLVNGAFMEIGKGRVVIMGEAAMFSAQLAGPGQQKIGMNHPQARHNAQFLLNLIHWLDKK
jgi:hypothetical protein